MAELKTFDCGLGPMNKFEWPCGHSVNATQDCPICSSQEAIKLEKAKFDYLVKMVESRNDLIETLHASIIKFILADTDEKMVDARHAGHLAMSKVAEMKVSE